MLRGAKRIIFVVDGSARVGERMSLEELSPARRAAYLKRLRSLPPAKRLQLALDTIDRGRAFILAELRKRHPLADERELQRLLAERLCGPEVATRAFGPR